MSNEISVSVTERLAAKYGSEKVRFYEVVKSTCRMEKATASQFEAFLLIAEKYDLNPLMKQMWAYPDRNGGIMTMVSIDGWISIVNNHPQFDGYETSHTLDANGSPVTATCTMWRKDRSRPTTKTIYVAEWKKDSSPVWKSMPIHFAEMRAFIQCARMCFNISGIVDEDANIELTARKTIEAEVVDTKPKKFIPDEIIEAKTIENIVEEIVIKEEISAQAEEWFGDK